MEKVKYSTTAHGYTFSVEYTRDRHWCLLVRPDLLRAELKLLTAQQIKEIVLAKWETLERFTASNAGRQVIGVHHSTCAYCELYSNGAGGCDGCPVSSETGEAGCEDTPFYGYVNSYSPESARNELEFLRNLEP